VIPLPAGGRCVAERDIIEQNYAAWEITGPPEIRDVDPRGGYFNPWASPQPDKTPVKEPPGNKPPAEKEPPRKEPPVREPTQIGVRLEHEPLDELERFLVLLFLRRYVTQLRAAQASSSNVRCCTTTPQTGCRVVGDVSFRP